MLETGADFVLVITMLDDTDISSDLAEARGKLNAARKALQVVLGVQDGRDGDLAPLQG
jgi:hypothetical protein